MKQRFIKCVSLFNNYVLCTNSVLATVLIIGEEARLAKPSPSPKPAEMVHPKAAMSMVYLWLNFVYKVWGSMKRASRYIACGQNVYIKRLYSFCGAKEKYKYHQSRIEKDQV